MILIFLIALFTVLPIGLLIWRLVALKHGILKSNGKVFLTHDTTFRVTKHGKLYIHCTGGKLADRFVVRSYPEHIDLSTLSKGQSLANPELDSKGLRIFSVIQLQTSPSLARSTSTVGNFVLNTAAQKRFATFLAKNFPNGESATQLAIRQSGNELCSKY